MWWSQQTTPTSGPRTSSSAALQTSVVARVTQPLQPPSITPQPPSASDTTLGNDRTIELQVALARRGFSPGAIDGLMGPQTRAALRALQGNVAQPREVGTASAGTVSVPPPAGSLYTNYVVTSNDLAQLRSLGKTWLAKSLQDQLGYETILEMAAEKFQSDEDLVWCLNPNVEWDHVQLGTVLKVPNVATPVVTTRASHVKIRLAERILQVYGETNSLIAHFPCSIGRRADKRPVGELRVVAIAPNPNYTFDPAVFPESAEGRQLGRKLILQPGPNNPVGTVWIGLDRPGYGVHGTPEPEKVGRTESHGCFRLANWNAEYLSELAWIGMPVIVEE